MTKLNISVYRQSVRVSAGFASTLLAVMLSGCALTSAPTPADVSNAAIGGIVHGGNQPVTQSNIALFAAGTSGYGATFIPLAVTTTDSNGNFKITTPFTCPANSQAYIIATGGNPGLAAGTDNSAMMMAAAIGPCSGIGASTNIWINEVTTVAAAYALSGFLPAGGNGLTESSIVTATSVPGVATSATNTQGLNDAFANAANIVNYTNGQAYTVTPSNTSGIVPQAIIYALADILQDCVNSSGPSSTSCTGLFTAAAPPTGLGIAAPVNTFQAAIDIAQYPANNPSGLYALISAQSAFPSTGISAAPNDWSIGITYTNSLLTSGTGLGINATDQVFVSGAGYLIDFSPQGAPLSSTNLVAGSAITSSDSLREIAFDTSGNLFVTDGAATGAWKFNPTTSAVTLLNFDVSPVSEANNNTYGIAVDGLGDVWTSSYSKATCASVTCPLVEFVSGTSYSPASTFSTFNVNQPSGALGGSRGTAFDVKTGNIWISAIDDNLGELFNVTPSASGAATATAGPTTLTGLGAEAGVPASNTAYGTISVAVDSTSRAWFVTAGGPATTGSHITAAIPGSITPVSSLGTVGTNVTGGGLNTPTQVAIDGNNNLFIANGSGASTGGSVVEYSPAFNSNAGGFLGANGISPNTTYSSVTPAFTQISGVGGILYEPSYLAVDRSGAVWTLSSGNGTSHPANLIQILGVAAPTNPVQAAGQYGVKP